MTDFNAIYIDTAPVIYCLENVEIYSEKVIDFFEKNEKSEFITSVVTVAEYFPHPFRQPNCQELIREFDRFIRLLRIKIVEIDRATAEKAAKIRAFYTGIKGMDSLQLASAIQNGCQLFLTNDRQLRQFREITCLTLDEL